MTSTPPLSRLLTEASSLEQGAMIFDRSGNVARAIEEYNKSVGMLTEALSLIPLSHPDCNSIEQHVVEIQSRVSYLSSLPMYVTPSIPLESHITPVQLSVNASRSMTASTTMGAAATIGGIGGLLLLGPLGFIAGAAGAAYATTRDDEIGSTARGVATTSVNAFDTVVDVEKQHNITEKAKEFGNNAYTKASEFNQRYEVTDRVKQASDTAVRRMSEFNDKYKVTDKISSGISAGVSSLTSLWNRSTQTQQYPDSY
jgi:hypothetical protein